MPDATRKAPLATRFAATRGELAPAALARLCDSSDVLVPEDTAAARASWRSGMLEIAGEMGTQAVSLVQSVSSKGIFVHADHDARAPPSRSNSDSLAEPSAWRALLTGERPAGATYGRAEGAALAAAFREAGGAAGSPPADGAADDIPTDDDDDDDGPLFMEDDEDA